MRIITIVIITIIIHNFKEEILLHIDICFVLVTKVGQRSEGKNI